MRSVAVIKPGTLKIVEVPEPKAGPYDVLVKNEIAFICNATDRKIVEGHFPGTSESWYPLLLGHESAGKVVAIGSKVRNFRVGQRAIGALVLDTSGSGFNSGWGGHSEYGLIKDHQAMVDDGVADEAHGWSETYQIMRVVPDDIPIEAAGLLCTWREVYSGLFDDFRLTPDMDIVIFGAGPIGLSFIRFAKIRGFHHITSVDPEPGKRAKALAMGADEALDLGARELFEYKNHHGKLADAVIDAVGNESVINMAFPLIRMGGLICVYGVVGAPAVTLRKDSGPYNFGLLFHQWPTRKAEAAAQEPLIEWIRNGELDYKDFVTGIFPVRDIEKAMAETKKPSNIKTMLMLDTWE
jgi:threonine dehydrogenase-like Zn-dependent dehydrogenase